jgi:phage gp46-like protein
MDAFIDPYTRDYVADPTRPGEWKRDPAGGLVNAAYLRLMTPKGSWFGNPDLGSRLHELAREKDLARVELMAVSYAKAALKPLLDDGRASSVEIASKRNGDGRVALAIELVDARGVRANFEFPVKVY